MRKGHRLVLLLACIAAGTLPWLTGRNPVPGDRAEAAPMAVTAKPTTAPALATRDVPAASVTTAIGTAPSAPDDATLQACTDDYNAALQRRLADLEDSTEARTQLVRGLLLAGMMGGGRASAPALARALELAPRDPLVAWSAAVQCTAPDCDRAAANARLVALDPDNAASWLVGLEDARGREDTAAIERMLDGAARATGYDDHYGETAEEIAGVLHDVPWPDSCRAVARPLGATLGLERAATPWDTLVARASAVSAASLAPAHAVVSVCSTTSGTLPPARATACEAALAPMARSDTIVARLVALTLLVQATAGEPSGAGWREDLRQLQYILERSSGLPPTDLSSAARRWANGEITEMQQRLVRQRRWPPPADWLPADPRTRALVTTGALPPEGR